MLAEIDSGLKGLRASYEIAWAHLDTNERLAIARSYDSIEEKLKAMADPEAMMQKEYSDGFRGYSLKDLQGKSDTDLADWQSRQPQDSAAYILAGREWERRLSDRELASQRRLGIALGILTVVGSLGGVLLGVSLK